MSGEAPITEQGPVVLEVRRSCHKCFESGSDSALTVRLEGTLPAEITPGLVGGMPVYRQRCAPDSEGLCSEGRGCTVNALCQRYPDLVEVAVLHGLWITTRRCHIGTPELARAILLLL